MTTLRCSYGENNGAIQEKGEKGGDNRVVSYLSTYGIPVL